MNRRLAGKVAVVTGGTSGIGEATVQLFVAEGAQVLFTGRNEAKGRALVAALGREAHFFPADVSCEAQIKASIGKAVERFGALDVLFNNAGGAAEGRPETITQESFDAAMNLLVGSVLFGIKHAVPHMKIRGGGSIISNASVAAHRSHMGGYLLLDRQGGGRTRGPHGRGRPRS